MARILIADDSLVMRRNIKTMLQQTNHKIIGEADNGKKAYMAAIELCPDLITMDINMPIMTGVEAVKKIKAQNKDIKIIMISSEADKHSVFSALEAGADNYLLKPLNRDKLIQVIDKVSSDSSSALRVDKLKTLTGHEPFFEQISKENSGYVIENAKGIISVFVGNSFGNEHIDSLHQTIHSMLQISNLSWHFSFEAYNELGTNAIAFFESSFKSLEQSKHEYTSSLIK
ncbi:MULTISPECIES: response regulator transcription factor [unclassified Fusibacter]|uniref:response regulator transcription factor n=1 Tax=unclassified Fusibacter TaxID=2624464 RepID=UPI001010BB97|nr:MULTISPECIES: response regulator [unclassified Fusibacter]MCK8060123.1 response regulator [Fusibacter sp. A2]NPE22265.1 response regulator [Fusibacter sp. A1]RXV61039.1 response regulator [Fusibacter sp. A1]